MESDANFTTCETCCLTDKSSSQPVSLSVFAHGDEALQGSNGGAASGTEMGISPLPATVPGCSMLRSWLHSLFMIEKCLFCFFFQIVPVLQESEF